MKAQMQVLDRLTRIANSYEHQDVISTGIDELNQGMNGGFAKGNLYLLAGDKGVGKTTFLVSLIATILANEQYPGIVSPGITAEAFIERVMANCTNIWLEKINRGKLNTNELSMLTHPNLLRKLSQLSIPEIVCTNLECVSDICRSWVMKSENQCRILFVDGLELLASKNASMCDLSTFASHLKDLAVTLQVPIIASITTDASNTINENLAPVIHSADIFMQLFIPSSNGETESKQELHFDRIRICDIKKNRFGKTDTIPLNADLPLQRFQAWDLS